LEVLCDLKSGRRARPSRHTYYEIGLPLKDQAFLPPVENPLALLDISARTGIWASCKGSLEGPTTMHVVG
jgi:hypothetical protein